MKNLKNIALALCACAGVSGTVYAQCPGAPAVVEDLGVLPAGLTNRSVAINGTGVLWYKFSLSGPVALSSLTYLSVDTNGSSSPLTDTEVGIYDCAGNLMATDDDDGSGNFTQLSFGSGDGLQTATGNAFGNGRDGGLAAGDYYLAVGNFNINFGLTAWGAVATSGTAVGTGNLNLTLGTAVAAADPAGTVDLGTLALGGSINRTGESLGATGAIQWYKVVLPEAKNSLNQFVDADTEGTVLTATNATRLVVYNNLGVLAGTISPTTRLTNLNPLTDTTDGSGSLSQISLGVGLRPAVGSSLAYNGRDGDLQAGTYYIGVAGGAGTTPSATNVAHNTNFGWTTTSTGVGPIALNLRAGLGSVPLAGVGSSVPTSQSNCGASSALLRVTVTPGTNPASTGIAVTANLSTIGLSASQAFFDDATNGDVTANDNIWSYSALIANSVTSGAKTLPWTVTDAQSRSAAGNISLTVNACPPFAVTGNAASGAELTTVLLTATVAPGPVPSTNITVTGNLSSIGGSATQQFYDDGTNGDVTAGNNIFSYSYSLPSSAVSGAYPLPVSAANFEGASANGTINLTVTNGPSGACCNGGCTIDRQTLCQNGGGTWQGAGSDCGGAPNYTISANGNTFIDISTTGTLLATISNADDSTQAQALPFPFTHLGNVYNSVNVSSNGNLQFGASNSTVFTNVAIPNAAAPNDMLAPMWDDFDMTNINNGPGLGSCFYLDDSATNNRVIFSWQGVGQYNAGGVVLDSNDFQAILYASGDVEFRYGNVPTVLAPQVAGDTVTVGYENINGTSGGAIDAPVAIGSGNVSFTLSPGTSINPCGPVCDGIDFNQDGLFPDTLDIDDFISVFGGGPCSNDPNCSPDIDFNNDGLFPDTLDIDALISVFGGGPCLV